MTRPAIEMSLRLLALALLIAGLYLAAFGSAWAPVVLELLPESELGAWIELIVPFLPMAFIASGAALFVSRHRFPFK